MTSPQAARIPAAAAIAVAALVRADERLHDEFPTITIPLLIMHGTEDKATVCRGSQFFYETPGSKDKTLKLYEGTITICSTTIERTT